MFPLAAKTYKRVVPLATQSATPDPENSGFDYIKFTVDAELLRELGERLVGKPYVALGELVKNAYDADATECIIRFGVDEIQVMDNGNGMTHDEFVGKWMRIGSTHKRDEQTSPRLRRELTGSKGVGRLSAQFLGSEIDVVSVARRPHVKAVHAKLKWAEAYGKTSLIEAGAWVREEPGEMALQKRYKHGTTIRIAGLKDKWDAELLEDLATELWFLQPPPILASDIEKREQFKISLEGVDEIDELLFENQTTKALENWIARLEGGIERGRSGGKATITLTFRDGESYRAEYELPNQALDEARFGVFIFKLSGRQASGISVKDARGYFKKFGGLHIYDAGFRLPYYGGDESDWLGLEMAHSHRLIVSQLVPEELRSPESTLQDLPTLGRLLGVVKVSTPHEAKTQPKNCPPGELLQVQITRDKLIENRAYEDLVQLVRWAFDFYSYKSTARRARRQATDFGKATLQPAVQLEIVRNQVAALKTKVPPQLVRSLENAVDQLADSELQRQRAIDAERVLLGALATAGMGAVALQHELAKELGALERLVRQLESHFGNQDSSELAHAVAALKSWVQMASQTRKMFSPFFDAEDREKLKRVRAKRVVERLASNLSPLLRGVKVETADIPDDLRLPQGTLAGWNAVFQNVFVNAVNAMLDSKAKRIRCQAHVDDSGRARLVIEDTGVGADLELAEEYFKPFVRKLDLPEDRKALGLGGMGIGLTIVRMVCQTFGCKTKFIKPRPPFKTAFEISWGN
jgi:signal transduction histidine kinase